MLRAVKSPQTQVVSQLMQVVNQQMRVVNQQMRVVNRQMLVVKLLVVRRKLRTRPQIVPRRRLKRKVLQMQVQKQLVSSR